tara:strand:+ start:143 stop:328 length:186 start_codon:yes stop_codon:yes gene_type:complete
MENSTEYILIRKLTAKENRLNTLKFLGGSMVLALFGIAVMYFLLFFFLWADEVTDKIIGLI